MTVHYESTKQHTRVFGMDGSSRELARRVDDELRTSAAWIAFVEGFGLASDKRFGWVSVDGCPFTPIQFGLDGEHSGLFSRLDRDALQRPTVELTDYLAQP